MSVRWNLLAGVAAAAALELTTAGCTTVSPDTQSPATSDASPPATADASHVQVGCAVDETCYTVYAHSDFDLYHVDLGHHSLVHIGPFNTPDGDHMTDLAVAPDDKLWAVSEASFLYSVNPQTGAATRVTSLATCGSFSVALSFAPDGNLYAGDYDGSFCRIDLDPTPPQVIAVGTLGNDLAIAGDLVAVSDGTLFGTAYDLGDVSTSSNNILVTIDPGTGHATPLGSTTYPNLFGVAFEQEHVFGFTHDGSGRVVTLDPSTGSATLYGTFTDPDTDVPITFAGAAVNPMVPVVVQ